MQKNLYYLGGIFAAGCLLVGCKQSEDLLYSPKNPVSITVWTYYNGDQLTAFNRMVEEFNATEGKEKGIFVESASQGTVNDLEINVLAAVAGKVGADEVPNIFAAYADTAYRVDQMGLAVDLSEYLTEEEMDVYVDSYLNEGRFTEDGGIKIFPTAKSTEIFLLNKTDWEKFADATGATYQDMETIEGLIETAERYYEWTDSQTPEPDDGKAFFGRDAVANYFLIGARQLGTELFETKNGVMKLNFDRTTIKRLWDCYYVPYIKGYFAATGRFRSDDIKTGNIISLVGSSSGATFFPNHVSVSDTKEYSIEMEVLPCPKFQGGEDFAVQQGAGMVVTASDEASQHASVEFLKWFTKPERNITFSINSGYMPVTKEANDMEMIRKYKENMTPVMDKILTVAVDTVNSRQLYTPKAFPKGTEARAILEYSLSDLARADREIILSRMEQGQSMDEASAEFLSDEYFESWYQATLEQLKNLEG